ncbi:MAG: radical SAM protein [Candidatus Omnitrophica bacterium]|nr:radical SAM protein [Candidatus Omnitrophota bacterium]
MVVTDNKKRIYDIPHLEAAGMEGGHFFRLSRADFIKLPHGSELFTLPGRIPVGYDPAINKFSVFSNLYAVAAFTSPGYTVTHNTAYLESPKAAMLPLFSYGAVTSFKGEFYVAAVRVDRERRQDLRFMDIDNVKTGVKEIIKLFPKNRLIRHLKGCALTYGCPAAKNFFLKRYEAPLPTSPYCNAMCIGCISHQPKKGCSITQPRIKFKPTPGEVAEVALYHIKNVKDPVVSFGQGCEGEPLMVGDILNESIKMIRQKTSKGMINLNTNASLPGTIAKLFDEGLDSIRVSLNSVNTKYYTAYYKPKGYSFKDVKRSIKIAKKKGGFVSLNYLTVPGFTDLKGEFSAFKDFIGKHKVDMIQWRNLNYDPVRYFTEMRIKPAYADMLGMKYVINALSKRFPKVITGYFNPSNRRIKRGKRL